MTKNHFLPSAVAQVRMRAENPVKRNSAGMSSPHSVVTTHRTLPPRWYDSACSVGSGTGTLAPDAVVVSRAGDCGASIA